jgi:hypothetical protein
MILYIYVSNFTIYIINYKLLFLKEHQNLNFLSFGINLYHPISLTFQTFYRPFPHLIYFE